MRHARMLSILLRWLRLEATPFSIVSKHSKHVFACVRHVPNRSLCTSPRCSISDLFMPSAFSVFTAFPTLPLTSSHRRLYLTSFTDRRFPVSCIGSIVDVGNPLNNFGKTRRSTCSCQLARIAKIDSKTKDGSSV